MEIRGNYFIVNTQRESADTFPRYCNSQGTTLYEVFRIIDRIPLFVEDHIRRFANSAFLAGVKLPVTLQEIYNSVLELIRSNRFRNANIKLIACYPPGEPSFFVAYFVEHQYPTPAMFGRGVDTITLKAIRNNPNAKIFNTTLRTQTNELKNKLKIYEVLLVDEEGNITEGSRSNFFGIRDGQIITPPQHEVLPGITRKHVLEACNNLQYKVTETSIPVSELTTFESVFLTGTSRKILPIRKIDDLSFAVSHPMMRTLMTEFTGIVTNYLILHK